MSRLLDLYHGLPYPLKVLAASLRGGHLERWRYGPDTEDRVHQATRRESWDESEWRAHQTAVVAKLLARAIEQVPHYRDLWRDRSEGDPTDLDAWPVLAKETVRADPRRFLADDAPRRLFEEHTSGSTGTPLSLWWSRSTTRSWYALFEARIRRWHGVDRQTRWANIGGQLVTRASRSKPPYWVWNPSMRQLYLSSYHLRPDAVSDYLEALADHRIEYLLGYPSSLHALASLAEARGLRAPSMRVAITNAEPLSERQRQTIGRAFDCPVRDTYGMAEIVCAASECRDGTLHLWPEVGIVEILDLERDTPLTPGREGAPGQVGRIVATGLLNHDMPLIRYDTGDLGSLSNNAADNAASCRCGRRLPVLSGLEGRRDDVVTTPDGRRVGRLDPVFKADLPIRAAQVAQVGADRIEVRIEPAPGWSEQAADDIRRRLADRVGPAMTIEIRAIDEIPRIAGKLRSVVREIEDRSDPPEGNP